MRQALNRPTLDRESRTDNGGRGRIAFGMLILLIATQLLFACELTAAESPPDEFDFFESRIRPVLIERCYSCHSHESGNHEADLFLDSRDGVRIGGSRGSTIVAGKPEASLLIQALRYGDEELQMPPAEAGGRLADATIADFEHWIRLGAPDPRDTVPLSPANDNEAAEKHWAFQPIHRPTLPNNGATQPVDAFIVQQLQENELPLNRRLDRRELLRRISYDLTGLPPTFDETQTFLQDSKPGAYADVVERLLESPAYGERWGRFWLDVARYADTRGYRTGGKPERYSFSHVYRDYVIQAFNDDKPFDQFIVEQIAADQLDLGDDNRSLAALGFLTLGRRFIDNEDLIIDDRIDVVTRGLMGLTVACARCHDHKFDPIPTADYYSLYGVFASSHEPSELPLLGELQETENYRSFLSAKQKLLDEVDQVKNRKIDEFLTEQRSKVGDYLLAVHDSESLDASVSLEEFAGKRNVDVRLLRRWSEFIKQSGIPAVLDKPVTTADAATAFNERCANAMGEAAAEPALHQFLNHSDCPSNPTRDEVANWLGRIISDQNAQRNREIEALNWKHVGAPSRAPVLIDRPNPHNVRIFKRGDQRNLGDEVPRQFVRVLSGANRQPFSQGSGRLELAQAIVSERNPLTARVIVNRVWSWHFGKSIVESTSDFGIRTPKPNHALLLDWLAADFVESGWSIKALHRKIVLSETYQQSSVVRAEAEALDPENKLWHSFPRRRLGFEATRDTLLAAAGTLDRTMGGVSVDITVHGAPPRRTVYAFIDRQNLPGLLRTFDYPNPNTSSPGRFSTTVPQQALFMMNSPFAIDQAKALAHLSERAADTNQRIQFLYRRLFQRDPTETESAIGTQYVRQNEVRLATDKLSLWERYAQALLSSNELVFVD